MTAEVRCWMVPVRVNPTTGKTEHEYVAATGAADALAAATRESIGEPRLAFPWLDALKPVEDDGPVADTEQGKDEHGTPHPMAGAIMKWLREYAGRNEFVLDVKRRVTDGRTYNGKNAGARKNYRLSRKQIEALAKVKEREDGWAKADAKPAAIDTGLDIRAALPNGTVYAAALNSEGRVSFVRFDKVTSGKWDGWVFVKAVIGDDDSNRLGAARPGQGYAGQWLDIIRTIVADVDGAVALYGKTIGKCGVCNRRLTNEESREYGIGPECRAKLGG